MVLYMIVFYNYDAQDMIFSFQEIIPFSDPADGIYLNRSRDTKFSFKLFVNDAGFDNEDNPYGKWIYHMYTNMKDINDTDKDVGDIGYNDRHIPLVDCSHGTEFDGWTSTGVKNYCPSFSDDDFLYGNWYSKRFAWSRLAFHFCDNSTEAE